MFGIVCAQSAFSGDEFSQAIASMEANGTYPVLDRTNTFTDVDQNGVRDDIDTYIDSLPENLETKANLKQFAAGVQQTLDVDVNDAYAVELVKKRWILGLECVSKAVGDTRKSRRHTTKLKAYIANTKERAFAAIRFSAALDGHVLSLINNPACDGDFYRPEPDQSNKKAIKRKPITSVPARPIAPELPGKIQKLQSCPPIKLSDVIAAGNCPGPKCDLSKFCKPVATGK